MRAQLQHDPHPDETAPVPYLRNGQLISLIHWDLVRGEWKYTTILAEYTGRDEKTWRVVTRGEPVTLDRSQWAIFS